MLCLNPVSLFSFSGCCAILVLFETVYNIVPVVFLHLPPKGTRTLNWPVFPFLFDCLLLFLIKWGPYQLEYIRLFRHCDCIKMVLLSVMCCWVETQSPLPTPSSYYSCTSSMRAHSCCTSTLCLAPPGLFLSMTSTGQPFLSLHANNFMLYRSICGTKLCHSSRRKEPAGEMQPWATWGAQLWSTHSFSLKSQDKNI